MKLLGEKILVRPHIETRTESGLIIPDAAQKPPGRGSVLEVGTFLPEATGCQELKTGDEILYFPYAGTEIMYEGIPCLVIRPNDVIGVLQMSVN